ncbi:hypothetical protein SD70_00710 [Gordoniibacillus kamchatkensis]|uniref:Pilus assembly protein PilM n=1 Tax=Gordoniibacillus kamchatkensis TaxID=1590651 RepID=A0ABR5AN60_9BACL|nr:hypothetical protein SD70_00710 [Paenibacillus sp. VKM B-2647]
MGLEITDQALKIAEIAASRNKAYRLTNFHIEPLPDCVEDGKITDVPRVCSILQSIAKKMNVRTKEVHLVIPSQHMMVRLLKLPDLPVKTLRKIVDFEVKHNVRLPFERPYYDFVKLDAEPDAPALMTAKPAVHPSGKPGDSASSFAEAAASAQDGEPEQLPYRDLPDSSAPRERSMRQCDVMLVASSLDLIEQYASVVRKAGLKPLSMEIKAMSLYRALEYSHMSAQTGAFVIVDINENATDISIFDRGQLKMSHNEPIRFDAEADLQDACDDLADEIDRVMNFYRYTLNNRGATFEQIVVSGDVDRFQDIVQRLEQGLEQKPVVFEPGHIAVEQADAAGLFPALAVPIGLALRGKQR